MKATKTTRVAKSGGKAAAIWLRVSLAPDVAIGPGKADLLDGIAATGSIAAAGRRLGMSYKRAWQLVEALNAGFDAPLVAASKGGSGGGGAQLTALGAQVLARYRAMQAACARAVARDVEALRKRTAVPSD